MDPYEPWYNIVSNIYILCVIVFSAYCYVLWIRPFLPDCGQYGTKSGCRGNVPDRKAWKDSGRVGVGFKSIPWKAGAAYAVVMLILKWMPFYVPNVLGYGLGVLASFGVMCLADRQNFGQKLFLAVIFFCMRWQAWMVEGNITELLYEKLVWFVLRTEEHERLSFLYELATESYKFWLYVYCVDTVLSFTLGAALLYGAVWLMRQVCRGGQACMRGKELRLMLTPAMSGVFAYGVVQFFILAYERETEKSIFDLPGYSLLMISYSLISYGAILVSVYVFCKWKQEQEEDGQRRIFAAQMKEMQSHIAEVERLYSDMRRLRHDMGNHLMTLEQLYLREEYGEAERYAETLKAEMENASLDIKSGNPVTDAILSGRKKEMEEQGIAFTCDFHYPQKAKLDAFDISIILNNALNNAIEAVVRERRREVVLISSRVKNMYMIEVVNPFTGELETDVQSGLPRTTKTQEGHGFGLAGIRHAARKYYGDIEIGVEEREGRSCCVLRVMLQIPPDQAVSG